MAVDDLRRLGVIAMFLAVSVSAMQQGKLCDGLPYKRFHKVGDNLHLTCISPTNWTQDNKTLDTRNATLTKGLSINDTASYTCVCERDGHVHSSHAFTIYVVDVKLEVKISDDKNQALVYLNVGFDHRPGTRSPKGDRIKVSDLSCPQLNGLRTTSYTQYGSDLWMGFVVSASDSETNLSTVECHFNVSVVKEYTHREEMVATNIAETGNRTICSKSAYVHSPQTSSTGLTTPTSGLLWLSPSFSAVFFLTNRLWKIFD